jgi:hypothetical protein
MPHRTCGVLSQIIAVHRHVKCANGYAHAFHIIHHRREPMRQRHPAGGNPHEHEVLGTSVCFEDLVCDSSTGAGNLLCVHHYPRRLRTNCSAGLRIIALGLWRAGT